MLLTYDSVYEEAQPNTVLLKQKAIAEMHQHKREARRYLQDQHCHELGPWKMKTPLCVEAICQCCGIAHQAFITLERGEIRKWSGCNHGLAICHASKRGKAQAAQFFRLARTSGPINEEKSDAA